MVLLPPVPREVRCAAMVLLPPVPREVLCVGVAPMLQRRGAFEKSGSPSKETDHFPRARKGIHLGWNSLDLQPLSILARDGSHSWSTSRNVLLPIRGQNSFTVRYVRQRRYHLSIRNGDGNLSECVSRAHAYPRVRGRGHSESYRLGLPLALAGRAESESEHSEPKCPAHAPSTIRRQAPRGDR